ncbi:MAG: hypothetical protein A3G94_02405 [Deltaproteobacteria bacterium RIFCSPLOWO2_12_FULL_60_16]|nr:MAG: hypothetical protein A3G94_02405 [Deltaproteobacteria bacterium RIFCSPLOWO2_12_FULL_60_16]
MTRESLVSLDFKLAIYSPLKKAHLPFGFPQGGEPVEPLSAGPRSSLRSDAIDLRYAEPKIRLKLLD